MTSKRIPIETLIVLRDRLSLLPSRSSERRVMIEETANSYGVSEATLRRLLRKYMKPKSIRRSDYGTPRIVSKRDMEFYCELVAAIKIRTSNKKGRHLSTPESIRLLEEHGVETPNGFVKIPKGILTKTTVNRYLSKWKMDYKSMNPQPTVVHFQAEYSNDCWQFDLSPSDLKTIEDPPPWLDKKNSRIQLMLFSVVDDRSGVCYQEYKCVYGEDATNALRFLFNAMSSKANVDFPFQGIPKMIYMDNGPIAKSQIFQRVMKSLGIEISTHIPANKDGRRVTARSKGKVERPFRTVKELHETLYHFHAPKNEHEANSWLSNFLTRYNGMNHRSESHSRLEDWIKNIPKPGIREMCSWDRFCSFAREPEQRKVCSDATVSINGVSYQVSPELAGQSVTILLGLFDKELYIEYQEERMGPYYPSQGPIPLNHYRSYKKTLAEKKADSIEDLAQKISISREALSGVHGLSQEEYLLQWPHSLQPDIAKIEFASSDPFLQRFFESKTEAKRAIANYLGKPLAKLSHEQLDFIDEIVDSTLVREEVMDRVKLYFMNSHLTVVKGDM